MKILYGVQGTGNGHITRARVMSQALRARNVEIDYLFSGRGNDGYFSMECFGNYQTHAGLTFEVEDGQVNYWRTWQRNSLCRVMRDIRQLDLSQYDLVLNDFEPISARAAKKQNKPCISLSHQNAFRYSVPVKGASWLDKQLIHHFAPADYYLGLHWHHFGNPILPPIIEPLNYRVESKLFTLVYLPFENINEVTELLRRFTKNRFICFHPLIKEEVQKDNIIFHPLSHDKFKEILYQCSGVITNGGFELPSEALMLGKKLLLKPLLGQFEQQSNVATLEMLGLATSMDSLDVNSVSQWLLEQPGEPIIYPNVADAVTDWILSGRWSSMTDLSQTLWQSVTFPDYVYSV